MPPAEVPPFYWRGISLRLRAGIIGQSGEIAPHVARLAEAVGAEIARRDGILFSGGRTDRGRTHTRAL